MPDYLFLQFNKGRYPAMPRPFDPCSKSLRCFLYSIIVEDQAECFRGESITAHGGLSKRRKCAICQIFHDCRKNRRVSACLLSFDQKPVCKGRQNEICDIRQ